ncbi:MAG: hypothetical protein Kow0089_00690 [Desulfobulbaceae bacterium]
MKKLTTEKDYVCIAGKPSDISASLNKINALYDLSVVSSSINDKGIVVVIIERRLRKKKS